MNAVDCIERSKSALPPLLGDSPWGCLISTVAYIVCTPFRWLSYLPFQWGDWMGHLLYFRATWLKQKSIYQEAMENILKTIPSDYLLEVIDDTDPWIQSYPGKRILMTEGLILMVNERETGKDLEIFKWLLAKEIAHIEHRDSLPFLLLKEAPLWAQYLLAPFASHGRIHRADVVAALDENQRKGAFAYLDILRARRTRMACLFFQWCPFHPFPSVERRIAALQAAFPPQ